MNETCLICDRTLIPTTTWRKADQDQRDAWKVSGARQRSSRGLCNGCYCMAKRDGTLVDYERKAVPSAVVVEEWERMDHANGSRAAKIRQLAPRLGMKPDALEKALDRAGVRGPAQQPSLRNQVRERFDCHTCAIHHGELAAAEGGLATMARRLSHDPDSPRKRADLETARGEVADAQASWDMHVEFDHEGVAA